MRGYEGSTGDRRVVVEVDLRDQGLSNDGVEVDLTFSEEYGGDTRVTITRKELIELQAIFTEALNYIGYPMKGYKE